MKLNEFEPTEHVYNQLIRVYAGAVAVQQTKHEHVEMYIKDAWSLLDILEKKPDLEINTNILNSMVLLYANALRPEELEAKVLPLFDKHRLPFNVFTFQELIRLFYNTRELSRVNEMYEKLKEFDIAPNKLMLGYLLQTAMRNTDTKMTIEALEKFVEIGHTPDERLLKKLSIVKNMDDQLYVLLHKHFPRFGLLLKKQRQFE
jgi:predicted MPP superfamily phosphohydrolase